MEALGVRPHHLDEEPSLSGAITWTIRQMSLLLLSIPVLIVGHVVFLVPYLGVEVADRTMAVTRDARSSIKFFAALLGYPPWIALLAGLSWWSFGWVAGMTALIGLPLLGLSTQWLREAWGYAFLAVRRYFTLRRSSLRRKLKKSRTAIAGTLEALRQDVLD